MTRVLIAEDEPSIVLSLEFLFRGAGYEVLVAANGAEAIAIAQEHRPDLLVLDIMLPVVDGFEVCRALRAQPAQAALRIVMLTARGRGHEVERALKLGANAYVTKPFGTHELMKVIAELLERDAAGR
jgi:DNA-binding response OmpR family regulator